MSAEGLRRSSAPGYAFHCSALSTFCILSAVVAASLRVLCYCAFNEYVSPSPEHNSIESSWNIRSKTFSYSKAAKRPMGSPQVHEVPSPPRAKRKTNISEMDFLRPTNEQRVSPVKRRGWWMLCLYGCTYIIISSHPDGNLVGLHVGWSEQVFGN